MAPYPRKAIERLGIAPLTSLFQYGKNDGRMPAANDWCPLTNPAHLRFNA